VAEGVIFASGYGRFALKTPIAGPEPRARLMNGARQQFFADTGFAVIKAFTSQGAMRSAIKNSVHASRCETSSNPCNLRPLSLQAFKMAEVPASAMTYECRAGNRSRNSKMLGGWGMLSERLPYQSYAAYKGPIFRVAGTDCGGLAGHLCLE